MTKESSRNSPSPDRIVVTTNPAVAEAEFDCFSGKYEQLVNRSVCLAGERVEYFAQVKALYVAKFLGAPFRGKILDFGCGVGLLSRFLLSSLPGCQLCGYDLSKASLAMIPSEVTSRGRFTSVERELDTDYDLIVGANVMHHVPNEQRQNLILGLEKRLSKAGTLVIFEHNPLNPLTRLAVKQCPFDVGVTLLWPKEVCEHFTCARLRTVRLDYITFFPRWLAWLRQFEASLAWCPLGAQYAILGQKTDM